MLPETCVTKHQSTPLSIVEERRFSVQYCESLKSGDNGTVSAMMQGTPSETFNFSTKTISNSLVRLDSVILILYLFYVPTSMSGTAVAQWLRYCATNQKVAGSIPDGVMELFIDINPSDRTMALVSTQPPTEMSTGSISWG
jgi:hypothetical protein